MPDQAEIDDIAQPAIIDAVRRMYARNLGALDVAQQLIVAGLEVIRMNTCGAHYRDELEAVREAVDQRIAALREVAN
jgi:hypothetical protein